MALANNYIKNLQRICINQCTKGKSTKRAQFNENAIQKRGNK